MGMGGVLLPVCWEAGPGSPPSHGEAASAGLGPRATQGVAAGGKARRHPELRLLKRNRSPSQTRGTGSPSSESGAASYTAETMGAQGVLPAWVCVQKVQKTLSCSYSPHANGGLQGQGAGPWQWGPSCGQQATDRIRSIPCFTAETGRWASKRQESQLLWGVQGARPFGKPRPTVTMVHPMGVSTPWPVLRRRLRHRKVKPHAQAHSPIVGEARGQDPQPPPLPWGQRWLLALAPRPG